MCERGLPRIEREHTNHERCFLSEVEIIDLQINTDMVKLDHLHFKGISINEMLHRAYFLANLITAADSV